MPFELRRRVEKHFTQFANAAARRAGSPSAFLIAVFLILVWAGTGPAFGFSETWQLVINTGTTIVTFLMVFVIQNTQNRDSFALQTKLDELIRTSNAENIFIGIEKLTDKELEELHSRCELAARRSQALLEKAKSEWQKRGR